MRTLIIEDENLTAKRLEALIKKYDNSIEIMAILPSVEETVEWLKNNSSPDLVFMDIHLEDDLAFRIFEMFELKSPVIFTTAYDEYMIQAFKVNSIDYLLKPINYEELVAAIDKFKGLKKQFGYTDIEKLIGIIGRKEPQYKSRFMITVGTKIRSIEVKDIAYFYSEDKLSFMVTKEGHTLPVDFSLDKLTNLLDPNEFYRISRQYLVKYSAIQNASTVYNGKLKLNLIPAAKAEVIVSGDKMKDFKDWFGR